MATNRKAPARVPARKNMPPRQQLAIRWASAGGADYVHHLTPEQVKRLAAAAACSRHGVRDELLILVIFDACLRCSEALGIIPADIEPAGGGWTIRIRGKGGRLSRVALSPSLAERLAGYARPLDAKARLFPMSRPRAFQIIAGAYERAHLPRPSRARDRVGTVHILRHSGAIERLRRTGNPKAVQDQLRHRSPAMTLRYMKTLAHDESLAIQQAVDFGY